jgi:hypothetical protein
MSQYHEPLMNLVFLFELGLTNLIRPCSARWIYVKKCIFPVDFAIHWKRALRLFGSRFFSCRFFDVGLKSAGKQKLLEVNIAHVRAPIFFPVD